MKCEKDLNKKGAIQLSDDLLAEVAGGGYVGGLSSGETSVSDGNCGLTVSIHEGKCKFHPDGIPNCNITCPYYYHTS